MGPRLRLVSFVLVIGILLLGCGETTAPTPVTRIQVQIEVIEGTEADHPRVRAMATNVGETPTESRSFCSPLPIRIQTEDGTILRWGNPCLVDCREVVLELQPGESHAREVGMLTEAWIDCTELAPVVPGTFTATARITYVPSGEAWGPENIREAETTESFTWSED